MESGKSEGEVNQKNMDVGRDSTRKIDEVSSSHRRFRYGIKRNPEVCHATFDDLLEIKSGKDYKQNSPGHPDSKVPVYGTGGVITYVESPLHTGDAIGIGRKGTIDKPQRLSGAFWAVDTLFYCLPKAGMNIDYLYQLCLTVPWKKYNEASGVPSLSSSTIKAIPVKVHSLPEQEKIADFLGALDDRIELQEKKIELLKERKKGWVQRIFSQQVRFRDDNGNEYPEWEEKTLGEVAECLDNKRVPLSSQEREGIPGPYPYYGSTNIQGYIDKFIFDEPLVLLAEDAAPFWEWQNKPIAQLVKGPCWVNNHTHVLKALEGMKTEYLFYSLVNKDITRYVNGVERAKLNQSDMKLIRIEVPCLQEQEKITRFLSALDAQIQLTNDKLGLFTKQKQGYLQRIFA